MTSTGTLKKYAKVSQSFEILAFNLLSGISNILAKAATSSISLSKT